MTRLMTECEQVVCPWTAVGRDVAIYMLVNIYSFTCLLTVVWRCIRMPNLSRF